MRWIRFSVVSLIVLMVVVPFFNYLETESEASVAMPMGYRPGLVLSSVPPRHAYEKLRFLDKTVVVNYEVKPQDTLWSIHQKFQIDEDTIRSSNMDDSASISAGKIIRIPNHRGTLYQVKQGETFEDIRKKFAWGRRDPNSFTSTVLNLNNYPTLDLNHEKSTPGFRQPPLPAQHHHQILGHGHSGQLFRRPPDQFRFRIPFPPRSPRPPQASRLGHSQTAWNRCDRRPGRSGDLQRLVGRIRQFNRFNPLHKGEKWV